MMKMIELMKKRSQEQFDEREAQLEDLRILITSQCPCQTPYATSTTTTEFPGTTPKPTTAATTTPKPTTATTTEYTTVTTPKPTTATTAEYTTSTTAAEASCPTERPEFNSACEEEMTCDYGSQECCGETSPVVTMECMGTWVGYYIDTPCAFGIPCPDDTTITEPADDTTTPMTTAATTPTLTTGTPNPTYPVLREKTSRSPGIASSTVFPECDGDCYGMPPYKTTTTPPRIQSGASAGSPTIHKDDELIPEVFEDDIDDVVQDVLETFK